MAYQKRNTWWGINPDKGKKGFSNQKDAEAYENGEKKKEAAAVVKSKDLFSADA
jgi:hypothetical protein